MLHRYVQTSKGSGPDAQRHLAIFMLGQPDLLWPTANYLKEVSLGVSWSHTMDFHQLLGNQCLSDNLHTSAIIATRSLIVTEYAEL